jgi:hypothetical protein
MSRPETTSFSSPKKDFRTSILPLRRLVSMARTPDGANRDVVDVGAARGHAAVVEDRDLGAVCRQVFGDGLLADRAGAPGALVGSRRPVPEPVPAT